MTGNLFRVFKISLLSWLQGSQPMEKLAFLNHLPWLSFKASGASQQCCRPPSLWAPDPLELPRGGAQVRSQGALQMQVPDFTALSASMLGGKQSPPGSFQIPRKFYSQHSRPLDCKSFFQQKNISQSFGIAVMPLKPGHSPSYLEQCY